jgi:hypothetical protein
MAWNHHQPDETDQDGELPAELRGMDQRLARDGARWRAQVPPPDALLRRVAAHLAPAHPTPAAPTERAPVPPAPAHASGSLHPWQYSAVKGPIPMQPGRIGRNSRVRGWLAAAAALLVVGALAALLYSIGPARPGGGHTAHQATATTTTVTGHWQTAAHLAHIPAIPIIAPSDAQVVYQVQPASAVSVAFAMERSDDGGATWQPLPVPQLPGPIEASAIRVNPVDAHNVFLQMQFGEAQTSPILNCPTPQASVASLVGAGALFTPLSNMAGCPALYASTDGGAHWTLAHLPLIGTLNFTDQSWPLTSVDAIQSQGDRLYAQLMPALYTTGPTGYVVGGSQGAALFTPMSSPGAGAVRLVTSADHGMTWQFADSALASQAPAVCAAYAAPQGVALYALAAENTTCWTSTTTARALWRSDDDGAHWSQVGSFQDEVAQFFADGGNGTSALLYAVTVDQAGNATLRQSGDGGHTWQAAPVAGLPSQMGLYLVAGVLRDGSVVAAMLPNTPGAAATQPSSTYIFSFYALQPGGRSWRQLSSPSPSIGLPGYLLVARGGTPAADGVWIVSADRAFEAPGATYTATEYTLG